MLEYRPMFVGHFALGFAAKRWVPGVSLGTLFAACQLADLLWPNFVLLGWEAFAVAPGATVVTPLDFSRYPYSHSLVALVLWGLAFAVVHRGLRRRASLVTGGVLAALVVSHWVLDVLTHRPDMPLAPGLEARWGLGLWNSLPWTLVVEMALFAAGVAVYRRATASRLRPPSGRLGTTSRDRVGTIGLWALVALLVAIYLANVFGPPPPSARAVAWSAQAMWLFVAWGFWVDRHRFSREDPATRPERAPTP